MANEVSPSGRGLTLMILKLSSAVGPSNISVREEGKVARARILLADDHKGMRDRVVNLLEREFEMLEPVKDGSALLEAASRLEPDVCLVDISMPIINGIKAAALLKETGSRAKIIFLTIHEDPDFL